MARPTQARQRGNFMIEFTLVFVVLLMFLFGIFDMARAMYLINTLPEATRRAAAAASNIDASGRGAVTVADARYRAIFRNDAGILLFGAPVTDEYVRIDYLALLRNGGGDLTMTPVPATIAQEGGAHNQLACAADPNGANCIRLVRARICAPGDASACGPVYYTPLFPLFPPLMRLPVATTIVPAETLGYIAGTVPGG